MHRVAPVVQHHLLTRWILLGAILLIIVGTSFEMIHFPGILTPPLLAFFFVGILVFTLIIYVAMAFIATRTMSINMNEALIQARWWGPVIGLLWWIEILEANVWILSGGWLTVLYYGAEYAAYLIPGVAATLAVRKTGQFRSGLLAAVWSGMVGGLLTFLGGTAILWIFNTSFLHDPQNMQEFLRSHAQGLAPDLQTFIVGDLLAGLIVHLTVISIIFSAIVGSIGALIGQPLHSSDQARRNQPHIQKAVEEHDLL